MITEDIETNLVKSSFSITYAFLVTTGTITFIEALRTKSDTMRHILNLETCISIVAAFFYGKFMQEIGDTEPDYKKLNETRYLDWSITTPIVLLVLILAFRYNLGKKGVSFLSYLFILILNFGMLASGYVGEIGMLPRFQSNFIGFLFFGGMFGYIYSKYLHKKKNAINEMLYSAFFILWALYGVFYQMEERLRNVGYNVLDLFSKCFVGIYFWSLSSGIFV
jgi:bacteriorhodopsin